MIMQSTPLSCGCELLFSSIDADELPSISAAQAITGNGGIRYPLSPIIFSNRHYMVHITIVSSSGRYTLPQQNLSN